MRITVRYFAAFRDAVGTASESIDTLSQTTGELYSEMVNRHRGMGHEPAALVARNDELCGWDTKLEAGDEILLFPPVAGG